MSKFAKTIIIIISALIVSILGVDRMPQLIIIIALTIGSVYVIKRTIDRKMRATIIALFLLAFLLQVSVSLFMYNQTVDEKYYGFSYKGDDYVYGDFGTIVGDLWRRGTFRSLNELKYYNLIGGSATLQTYQLYSAFIFYLFGACGGQILLILNCFLHVAVIIPVYFICKDLNIKDNVVIFTISLFLFWPSTFCWSLFNFKEPMILLSLFAAFSLLILIRKKQRFRDMVFLLIVLYVMYCLKRYLLIIFFPVGLYFLYIWKWKYKYIIMLVILLFFTLWQLLAGPIFTDLARAIDRFPELMFEVRGSTWFSNVPYFTDLLTYTYPRTAVYLPLGALSTLFLPFLLRPFSLMHIGANIESIAWWCLMPFLISGIWISLRRELKKAFIMVVIFLSWLTVLAVTQGNMGTLIRQKAILYYIGFIFIGLAIDRTLRSIEKSGNQ